MSGRGKGACPQCSLPYANRYKPDFCSCGFQLGGSFEPKTKKRKINEGNTEVVEVLPRVYSTKSSTRNDRCIVTKTTDNLWICLHKDCLKMRATFVLANNPKAFNCDHVALVERGPVSEPQDTWTPTEANITSFTECSETVKADIKRVVDSLKPDQPIVISVCENKYLVFGHPSATNTIGYCHVTKADGKLFCASKDCKSSVAKCKHVRQKELCLHLHTILLYNKTTKKVFVEEAEASKVSSLEEEIAMWQWQLQCGK